MRAFDLLVAGEINPDLILSDPEMLPRFGQAETLIDEMELAIGSSAAIMACGAARLGLKVAFVGVVGDDLFGRFMLEKMEARGIDVSPVIIDPTLRTGASIILNRGEDRAILTYLGAMDALRPEQIGDELLRSTQHFHVSSYFLQTALQPGLPGLFAKAHQFGATTSLDTNWDPSGGWSGLEDLLPCTDVLFPNRKEALALTGATRLEDAVRSLAQTVGTAAVKLGGKGALARRGNHTARVGALRVQVADTVGAGDSFDAGFLYGTIQNWELEDCLRLGVACGSLSTRAHGGTTAQPDLDEAQQAMKDIQ